MPSVQSVIRQFGLPSSWNAPLSSLQRYFGYVYYSKEGQFEVAFDIDQPTTRKIVISISLLADFPSSSPVLFCKNEQHTSIRQHFKIDPSIHPALKTWDPKSSYAQDELGKLIWDICFNTFKKDPPMGSIWTSSSLHPLNNVSAIKDSETLNRMMDSSSTSLSTSSFSSSMTSPSLIPSTTKPIPFNLLSPNSSSDPNNRHMNSSNYNGTLPNNPAPPLSPFNFSLPPPPDFAHILRSKSLEDIFGLMEPAFLDSFYESLDCKHQLDDKVVESTTALDSIDPLIRDASMKLADLVAEKSILLSRYNELSQELAKLKEQQRNIQQLFSPQAVAAGLLSSSQRDNLKSEVLASNFQQGIADPELGTQLDIKAFIAKFMEARISCRIREDKRNMLLSSPAISQSSQSFPHQAAPMAANSMMMVVDQNASNMLQSQPFGGVSSYSSHV